METVIKNGWYGTAKKVWITGKCLHAKNRHEVWAVGCLPVFMTSVVLCHPLYEWLNYQMNLRVERIVVQRIPSYQTWNCKTQLVTNHIFFTIIAIFFIWTEEMVEPQGQNTEMSESSTWDGRLVDRDGSDASLDLVPGIKMTIIISQTFVPVGNNRDGFSVAQTFKLPVTHFSSKMFLGSVDSAERLTADE